MKAETFLKPSVLLGAMTQGECNGKPSWSLLIHLNSLKSRSLKQKGVNITGNCWPSSFSFLSLSNAYHTSLFLVIFFLLLMLVQKLSCWARMNLLPSIKYFLVCPNILCICGLSSHLCNINNKTAAASNVLWIAFFYINMILDSLSILTDMSQGRLSLYLLLLAPSCPTRQLCMETLDGMKTFPCYVWWRLLFSTSLHCTLGVYNKLRMEKTPPNQISLQLVLEGK